MAEPGKDSKVIELDTERYTVKAGGKEVHTTPKAFDILKLLVEADGKVQTREQLAYGIWGDEYRPSDLRTVDQHIARLRFCLGKHGEAIKTVTGRGYKVTGATIQRGSPVTVGKVEALERKGRMTRLVVLVSGYPHHITRGARVTL